jgi:outer membrane protein assembly factor BamA
MAGLRLGHSSPVWSTRWRSGAVSFARAVLVAIACLVAAGRLEAEPARLTPYEVQTLEESAAKIGWSSERDPAPEGKAIEEVRIVVLDVFDEHDPVPDFFNVFHTMTREGVIQNELLFQRGEPFSTRRADETARNLRKIRQLSLVLIAPVRGSAPDRVRLLVIVKDVWSLRMNSDFAVSGDGLSYLVLNPSEENLAGTHASLGMLFRLDPGTYSFGGIVSQRRIAGTDLEGLVGANVIYNRQFNEPEGSFGYFAYGEPLLATTDRWGWGTGVYFRNEIVRRYRGDRVETYDAPSTPADDALPIAYRNERIITAFEVTRSFGRVHKLDWSVGFQADRRYARHDPPPGTAPSAEADFRSEWLPVNDTGVGPFTQVLTHEERYLRTVELDTLGLQEDFRLGPQLLLRVSAGSSELGSSRSTLGFTTGAAYTLALGNGLVRALAANSFEYAWNDSHDAVAWFNLRIASPRLGIGRLVADAAFRSRYINYLNLRYGLGGDTRLRGYPSSGFEKSFSGAHYLATNLEFRTASVDILTAQSGLAAFYDMGHAARRLEELSPHHSVGLGVRILFPQASRTVFRADWAFPLNPIEGTSTFPGGFFVTFGQAFGTPELDSGSLANPETYLATVPR